MQRLLNGVLQFRNHVFNNKRELFEDLAKGQKPEALFITCADSRICPSLITQSSPGELFVLRNAGNIIPPAASAGGEAATIEYAINVLGIRNIIVCGHTHCGAMAGLLDHPAGLPGMKFVSDWLRHAEAARRLVVSEYRTIDREEQLELLIKANVLQQIENLCSLPAVARALANDQLDIHGWIYRIETGEIHVFDLATAKFRCLSELMAADGMSPELRAGLGVDMKSSPMVRALMD